MHPVVNGVKARYLTRIKFADLDFYDNNNKALARQFGATYHPVFVLVDGQGKLVRRWVGPATAAQFEESFKQVLPA